MKNYKHKLVFFGSKTDEMARDMAEQLMMEYDIYDYDIEYSDKEKGYVVGWNGFDITGNIEKNSLQTQN